MVFKMKAWCEDMLLECNTIHCINKMSALCCAGYIVEFAAGQVL